MKLSKKQLLTRRAARVRKQIGKGTVQRPRLTVFRSNSGIYAQMIDDISGKVIVSAQSRDGKSLEAAKKVGTEIAEKAKKSKVTTAVFDRSGYAFHGRVKALADAAREGGLAF